MNPNSSRQSVLLGLFIVVGISILVAALFSVGSVREGLRRRIAVTAIFPEVKGLQPGDAVWFSGVTVGTVKGVGFADDSTGVAVEMKILSEASEHIPSDVVARIGSDSLIGNPIVILYDGTLDARHLESGDRLAVGTAVTPEAIMARFQESNDNLLVITTNLATISERLVAGEGTAGKLLTEDQLYNDLSESIRHLTTATQSAEELTKEVALFTTELNKEGNLAHDLLTDQSIHTSLVEATASLEEATASAALLLESLEKGVGNPETPAGVLLSNEETGADLSESIANLKASSALLEEDLEALQHNFLLRRYFKKKAKAAEKERKAETKGSGR